MRFKKIGIILFLIFFFVPMGRLLAQTTNAGFVPGNIWYSEDPFSEGDKIKIYTLIFNPDTRKFSGTVDFFDNSTLLGTKNFNVAATSTEDIYISWTVTAGDHQIYGQIQNAKFLTSSGTYIDANLTQNQTSKSSRTVASKVVAQNINNGINTVDGTFNNALSSIQNLGNTAKNILPSSVPQLVTTVTNTLDGLRSNLETTVDNAQKQTQNNIDSFKNTKTSSTNSINTATIQEPFYYVGLYFLTILAFILKYKILFYGIIVVIALVVLRFIWNLIF